MIVANGVDVDLIYFNGSVPKTLTVNGTSVSYLPRCIMPFDSNLTDYGSDEISWTATGSAGLSSAQSKTNGYSLCADNGVMHAAYSLPSTYEISFWLRTDSANLDAGQWGAAFSTSNTNGLFIIGDGSVQLYIDNALEWADDSPTNDVWRFFSLSWDGSTTTLKIDDATKTTTSANLLELGTPTLVLGGYYDGSTFYNKHKPYIDRFKIK